MLAYSLKAFVRSLWLPMHSLNLPVYSLWLLMRSLRTPVCSLTLLERRLWIPLYSLLPFSRSLWFILPKTQMTFDSLTNCLLKNYIKTQSLIVIGTFFCLRYILPCLAINNRTDEFDILYEIHLYLESFVLCLTDFNFI